jgi:hypothetical protein
MASGSISDTERRGGGDVYFLGRTKSQSHGKKRVIFAGRERRISALAIPRSHSFDVVASEIDGES